MSDKRNRLRDICNAAFQGNNQLCRWNNGSCGTSNTRITVRRNEDYLEYEEDVTDSSEDYDYNDYDYYEDEDEEGEDSEDMFSTSEDYADSY
jgi:hypothetical protein